LISISCFIETTLAGNEEGNRGGLYTFKDMFPTQQEENSPPPRESLELGRERGERGRLVGI
jgi:hypothetical protein